MKGKTTIKTNTLRFEDITSRKQRADLNELLRAQFGAPPGVQIEYKACRIERRGGIYWADLRAVREGARLDFNVKFMNASGEMNFAEGWRLKHGESVEMHLYRGA